MGRHGIRQLRTGWADGPAYITQCPIQPGQSYVYNFTITGQRGTLLWHAHILWLRATIHGGIVILPKLGVPYPFPTPHKEEVIILGKPKFVNTCIFFIDFVCCVGLLNWYCQICRGMVEIRCGSCDQPSYKIRIGP